MKQRGEDTGREREETDCRLDSRKFFFSQKVVNSWNSLPQHIIEPSVNCFKKRLDDYYQDNGPALKMMLLCSIIYKYKYKNLVTSEYL